MKPRTLAEIHALDFGPLTEWETGPRFHYSIPVLQGGRRIGEIVRTYQTREWRAGPELAAYWGADSIHAKTAREARQQCAKAEQAREAGAEIVRPPSTLDEDAADAEAEADEDPADYRTAGGFNRYANPSRPPLHGKASPDR